ncbi:V-set and transmembrane domain-containing protein 2-like protein isoform X1 [Danio rerio]|uniref:V-set and transmembrane domain-containing protein 2-like protein n=2 Tax=Danio rerio TaxID=7955 RepID=A0A0R4ILX9_DANRE|nr:V-set and transmembrane domain-containing protein 2-like protein precursor [Danio rerio]XP_009300365.1 V-set and transmembrane domain-containing protein 2-like protein [Danio rerio]|eukprot:XP_009300365.1 V-set and transmembrane domain-containing protein 2-like protein [Danio rerio]
MGSFGGMFWILHWIALYVQISSKLAVDNHVSGNALFTEVPADVFSRAGEDVEMSCSFRGSSSSSVSLEIQWWYSRQWAEPLPWATNQVVSQENASKGATKISVVKVVGSNISHKLRLSNVKPSDEGTYECRVIDFSENRVQRHQVQAYLQIQRTEEETSENQQKKEKQILHHHHPHHLYEENKTRTQ